MCLLLFSLASICEREREREMVDRIEAVKTSL